MQTHLRAFLGSRCCWGPCFVSPAHWLLGWETATGFGEVVGERYCIRTGHVWDHVTWCFECKIFSRAYLTAYLKELSRFCNWQPKLGTPHPNLDSFGQLNAGISGLPTQAARPPVFSYSLDKLLTPCLRHVLLTSFVIQPSALRQSLLGAAPPNPRFRS